MPEYVVRVLFVNIFSLGLFDSTQLPANNFLPTLFTIFMGNRVNQTPLGSKDGIIGAK